MDYLDRSNVIARVITSRRERKKREVKKWQHERTWSNVAGFEDGGKGHKPKLLGAGKGKETKSPSECPKLNNSTNTLILVW